MLLDYTSYPEIRTLLGVNDVELGDDTLSLDLYSSELDMELKDISPLLRSKYREVRGISMEARSELETDFLTVVRVFAAYTVAKKLTGALPMFSPKTVTDSKTEVSRFSNDPYKATVKSIKENWELNRNRVEAAFAALSSGTATRVVLDVMLVSNPSYDPVTG